MSARKKLVVLGTLAANPWAGMAWMHMQIAVGLARLGHDVHYLETTSSWPYDPTRRAPVRQSSYALPYLARVVERFGLGDRWAYRRSYSDNRWFGPDASDAEDLLLHADAVLNVAGATSLAIDGLKAGRLVYYGTDPVHHELRWANGEAETRALIAEHDDVVTYGENIGTPHSPIPPLPHFRATTRQPVLLDCWRTEAPPTGPYTTVGNWRQDGHDVEFQGETYTWSKHHEFLKVIDLPRRVAQPIELALSQVTPDDGMLRASGWRLTDPLAFTTELDPYRDYVRRSRGELTVAKDQNVRLRSGWFSERSACYLAAGRPVITQDTGFGTVVPTGEGLFAFGTIDEAVAAFEAIESDYGRHSRAARAIAEEYFAAEKVLGGVLAALGL